MLFGEFQGRHDDDCLKKGFFGSLFCLTAGIVSCLFATGLQYGYKTAQCRIYECCNENWISPNITELSLQLHQKLYGQHLAVVPIVKLLRGHFESQPQKAFVMSLNGLPGTGKNFVTRIVAENIYVNGMDSKYVHFLSATKDFQHENLLEDYMDKMKQTIETSVQECPRSMFIIDEMDKLLPGLIDTLRPYVDLNNNMEGIDYRQSLFFFLSNTGGDAVVEKTIQEVSENGKSRMKLPFKEMEEIVRVAALNDKNGLYQSSLVKNSLISAYIPFLPLERKHVKQCILDGLFAKGFYEFKYQVDEDVVEEIADQLMYFPNTTRLFSTTGCKRVIEKIFLVMEDYSNTDIGVK